VVGPPKGSDGDDVHPCHHSLAQRVLGDEPEHKLCLQGEGLAVQYFFGALGLLGEYVHLSVELMHHCEEHVKGEWCGSSADADCIQLCVSIDWGGRRGQHLHHGGLWGSTALGGMEICAAVQELFDLLLLVECLL
jgi:hypothetical protein